LIPAWAWAAWIVIGFVMEMVALFNDHPNDTLSAFLVQHVPGVWIMAGIAWLAVHFLTRHKGRMRTPE
jgi:hypothetical protein